MRKKSAWFGVIGLLVTGALLGAFFQSGEDLFQKALRLERNEGKLMEAIELYNKVVAEEGNETLAAQAQLRIGLCYEMLGQKNIEQAQQAFQKVIDNFPGQTEAVKVAQEKLSNFLKAQSAIEKAGKEFSIRKVMSLNVLGNVSPDGRMLSYVDWNTGNGELAVMEIATGKKRCLTHKAPEDESWHFVNSSIVRNLGCLDYSYQRWKTTRRYHIGQARFWPGTRIRRRTNGIYSGWFFLLRRSGVAGGHLCSRNRYRKD